MTTRWKKRLSLLLTILMLMSMLPTTALAAPETVTIYLTGPRFPVGATVNLTIDGSSQELAVTSSWGRDCVFISVDSPEGKQVSVTYGNYTGSATIRSSWNSYYATVELIDPDAGLPIYFFIAEPGENAGADPNGNYEDYPVAAQGSAMSTGAAANSATINTRTGIRNASPESIITDYVDSWPSGFTAETFKQFGKINVFGEDYYDTEYEIVWVSICKRGDGIGCYCSGAGEHIHIDGVLTKKVTFVPSEPSDPIHPADIQLIKTIPAPQEEDQTFTFELIRLRQDSNLNPIEEVDTSFDPLSLTATISANETNAAITGTGGTFHFGYYMLRETSSKQWYSEPVYIQVATDGSLKYSDTFSSNPNDYSTVSSIIVENMYQQYSVTYTDGVRNEVVFNDQKYTVNYGTDTPVFGAEPSRPGYRFIGWSPSISDTVTDDVTYTAQWELIPGNLEITKTFSGLPKKYHPQNFSILVTGPDNYYKHLYLNDTNVVYDSSLNAYTWTLTNRIPGNYTIVEDDYTIAGYTWVGGHTDAVATIISGETTTATLSNVYQVQTFTVTYTDGVDGEVIFTDQTTTEEYDAPTPVFAGSTNRPGYKFLGWTPSVADTVTETVTYTAVYAQLFNVTYTDGVDDEVVFPDQVTENIPAGDPTPTFAGSTDRPGYDFIGWQPEVSNKVTATVTYTAQWKPATNTKYTVKHYIQNADDTGWVLEDTETKTGTTGESVTAHPATISGYVYDSTCTKNVITGIIAADGSLVLELYYRPVFTVTWKHDPVVDSRPLETDKNVMYGKAPSYDGTEPTRASDAQNDYTFAGWSTDSNAGAEDAKAENQLPAVTEDVTYYAIFAADPHTFTGTVYVVLDGTANADGTMNTGTLQDIQDISHKDEDLFLSADGSTFYPLTRIAQGTYVHTALPVGNYRVYDEEYGADPICPQTLTIAKIYGDRSRCLFYNSVTYDLNGGTWKGSTAPVIEYYHEGHGELKDRIAVGTYAPVQEGYNFLGWKRNGTGDLLSSGDLLTASISQPYTLVAQWEKAVNVNVIIQLDHTDDAHPDAPDTSATADDVTFTLLRGAVDAAAPVPLTGDSHSGYTYTYADNRTTYESTGYAFTGLPSGDYTVYVAKANYKVISRHTTVVSETEQTVTVVLQYVSDSFELDFKVKMESGVPKSLWPHAVHVKVTQWNGSAWKTIAPLASASPIPVIIGTDGTGIGSYTVDKTGVYRVEVLSYESASGNKISVSTDDKITYVSANNICYGIVSIEAPGAGTTPENSTLPGANFVTDAQNGVPTVTVDIQWGSLTFDPNDGTLNDSTDELTLEHLIRVPSLTPYTPVRTGGYVFQGYDWYNDTNENQKYDAGTDTPASALAANAPINSHYILVARWDEPITVEGNVYVQWDELDPITSVELLLQRSTVSTADEHFTTIDPEVLNLSGITPIPLNGVAYKVVPYSFSGLENVGTYRIRILANDNFDVTYQNESAGAAPGTDFTKYSATGNLAVLNGDNSAVINAHVKFDPHTVDLPFAIDATAIGTDFQPTEAEMKILYRGATGDYKPYPASLEHPNPVDLIVTQDALSDSYTFKVVP